MAGVWPKKNRRKYPRARVPLEVKVDWVEGSDPSDVTATNLSAAGMEVVFPQRLAVLSQVGLSFRLMEDDELIECRGVVTRCLQCSSLLGHILNRHSGQYILGISFLDVKEEIGQKLRDFVQTHRPK